MPTATPNPKTSLRRNQSLLAVLAALSLTFLGSLLIQISADDKEPRHKPPLPVAVVSYHIRDHYQRRADFTGVVRATRNSVIGFEVPGTVDSINVLEGARVSEGDVLATLNTDRRNAQLAATTAELAQIDAELELARLLYQRTAELKNKGLASTQAFDEARLGVRTLEASHRAATARRDSAKLDIAKSTLQAPYTGIVAERLAQTGTVVAGGSPVLRLIAATGHEAHIGLPLEMAKQLHIGDLYSLRIAGKTLEASLRSIRADVDPSTQTVDALFELPSSPDLAVGQGATLQLQETIATAGGWLPLSALLEGDRGLWNVLVLAEDNGATITRRESVEVIYSEDDRVFVRGTLTPDARVVATGLHRLSPGLIVQPLTEEGQ